MKVDGVRITWIAPEEQFEQQDRPGFAPVCQYGRDMRVEPNELGAIVRAKRPWRPMPTRSDPLGRYSIEVTVLERIFFVEPA